MSIEKLKTKNLSLKRFEIYFDKTNNFNKLFWIVFFFVLLFFSFILSISIGEFNISLKDFLLNRVSDTDKYVFLNIRVLRALIAIIAGAGLSVSGCVIQNVLKNPMASPFTLGISQGASFGASFSIIILGAGLGTAYGEGVILNSPYITIACAFIGSLIAMGFIVFVSFIKNLNNNTVILTGVAIGAFFSAMTMLTQYFTSDVKAAASLFWTFGDVSKGSFLSLYIILFFLIISFIWFILKSWDLNALLWGDEISKTLGVNVKLLKIISLILVSLLTSVITAFLGVIGFVGLMGPHIAVFFTGHDNRYLIPLSAIMGGLILNLSDIISRILIPPSVIPVGIITSFFGIFMFLFLILRRQDA